MSTKKQALIVDVIEQIKQDIHNSDYTAIEELLNFLPVKTLQSFLSEME
jgi:hypothetical protein